MGGNESERPDDSKSEGKGGKSDKRELRGGMGSAGPLFQLPGTEKAPEAAE